MINLEKKTLMGSPLSVRVFMLFLPLTLIGIFVLFPLLEMFVRGFIEKNGGWTLEVYKQVLSGDTFGTSLQHSVVIAVAVSALTLVISICYSVTSYFAENKVLKKILNIIVLVSMVSPPFVASLAYIELYGRRGLITNSILHLNLNIYNAVGIILMESVTFAPFCIIFLSGLMKNIKSQTINSAKSLGANTKQIFYDVILPGLKNGIFAVLLLTFIRSMADYGTPIIIGGRYSTIASDIYLQIIGYSNLERVSVLNMSILLPSIIAFFLYIRCEKKISAEDFGSEKGSKPISIKLSKAGLTGFVLIFTTLLYTMVIALQYFAVFFYACMKHTKRGYEFTTEYLKDFSSYSFTPFLRSIRYAIIVFFIASTISAFLSYFLSRNRVRAKSMIESVIMLPYTIAGTSFGIGYILAFSHKPLILTETAIIVIFNMVFKQLPVTYRLFSASINSISLRQDNSARNLGASRFRVFSDIILPNIKEAIFSSFAYNFSSSMTTAGAIIFLITPSRQLAVFKLFDAVYVGNYGYASVIASAIIVTVLIAEILCNLFLSKRSK